MSLDPIKDQFIDPSSDECIIWAFRFFLGREPKNQAEINAHKSHKTLDSLRNAFYQTQESKKIYAQAMNDKKYYTAPLFLLPTSACDVKANGITKQVFSPPSLEHITSQLCSYSQFGEEIYKDWCKEMGVAPALHRKQWEFVWILTAMKKAGILKNGMRALGFGTGKEPIPAVLAKHGVMVVASDAPQSLDAVQGWSSTNQYSRNVGDLFLSKIVSRGIFDERVSWRAVDMNLIPPDLADFDACWSACAFEHLGSIEKGLQFVKNSLYTLKPGGYAIHTTEFNLTSNSETAESPGLAIFRKCDIEKLTEELIAEGHNVWPLNFHPGNCPVDEVIDTPPYSLPHLKLELIKYTSTSIGIVVQKGRSTIRAKRSAKTTKSSKIVGEQ